MITAPIDIRQIKRLELPEGAIRKLSPEEMVDVQKMREMAFMPEYSHIEGPPDEIYAEVKVGGKTVATLYNSGQMVSTNAAGARLQNLPSVRDSQQVGPALAKERAEEVARVLGGQVVTAKTALGQGEWEALPKPQLVTDWEALRRDPRLQSYYRTSGDTLVQAQLLRDKDAA